ncbi:MAG: extracellular solute-binding protein [Clostridia bacterium]|nr:extracellular solute-binding protein [Clostridia bacterium]
MKKFLSLIVALVLCLSTVAFAAPMITEPAWEGETIKSDIVVYMRSNQGVKEDIWWWDFCREYFKINFTVTQTTSASDYKSIAFMGGEMPDVFYQLFMSSNQQTEMGDLNGFLLELQDYITPELMPNLCRIFDANPGYKEKLMTQTGCIYGLGSFNKAEDSNIKFYINQRWLDEANLAMPETLEQFEEVLAAFKTRTGKDGTPVTPMGGDYGNCPRYLAYALGWVPNSASYLTSIALYGEELNPEFIYGNKEMFPIFMQYMKKWIDAGYFSLNLFASQVAGDEANALKANDAVGFEQNYSNVLNQDEWKAVKFLTSEYNPTVRIGRTYNAMNNQSFSMASDVEESKIERLIKWADWHYDYNNYQLSHRGPSAEDTEWLCDLKSGWTPIKNAADKWDYTCAEVEDGTCGSFGDYQNKYVQGIIGGYFGLGYDMFGESRWNENPASYPHGEDVNVLPYLVDPYPQITFLSLQDVEKTSALSAAINTYVNEQYAAFVTGVQEINEANLEAYFAQLDKLGFQEYQQIYVDYYNEFVRGK